MSSNGINASARFYGTEVGKVNEQSIVSACAALNLEMLEKHGSFDSAILMGLGEGSLLARIGPQFDRVIVVEASDVLVSQARDRFANMRSLQLVMSYFENYHPEVDQRVSCILGNHVLEHVDDPVEVLRRSRGWLKPDGVGIFTVPNATSLHRRIGVELGMLERLSDLNAQDRVVGHQRVYDSARLHDDAERAGYLVVEEGGFNLKLVSQAQMASWPESLHQAIFRVSRECPAAMCSNLYVVCRPR